MSLNTKTAPMNSNKKGAEPLAAATYPARVVQVIDLGLQKQEYQGEVKAAQRMVAVGYEFLDEFLKDEDGQELKDKPRWLSEMYPVHNEKAEKAKSTKRMKAYDPDGKLGGDLLAIVDTPVMVTVVTNPGKGLNAGKVFNKIADVAPMRAKDAATAPKLVNKPVVFSLDEPDVEVFKKLPQFIQAIIVTNLEFSGSKLEAALKGAGQSVPPKQEKVETPEEDEDNPFD